MAWFKLQYLTEDSYNKHQPSTTIKQEAPTGIWIWTVDYISGVWDEYSSYFSKWLSDTGSTYKSITFFILEAAIFPSLLWS